MKRAIPLIAVVIFVACGEPEQSGARDVGAAPPAVEATGAIIEEETGAGTDVVVTCIEYVENGRYAEAISVCEAAVAQAPDNDDVASALANARSQAPTGVSAAEAWEEVEEIEIEPGFEKMGEEQAP